MLFLFTVDERIDPKRRIENNDTSVNREGKRPASGIISVDVKNEKNEPVLTSYEMKPVS